jgi:hypothetical protein
VAQKLTAFTVVAAALGGTLGVALAWFGLPNLPQQQRTPATTPIWTEVAWPFPLDQWGKGKAFQCKAEHCGAEVSVYLRAKLGFCNCTTGVVDDEDLDRMGDLVLLGNASPIDTGRPINIAWMSGRSRAYTLANRSRPAKTVISVVYNERCDMIAATAVLAHDRPAIIESSVIEFLNGDTAMRWAEITLGL